jgi:glutathionyl-hydroquinone reductase
MSHKESSSSPAFNLSKIQNDLKKQLIQQIDNLNDQIEQAIENGKTAGLAALEAQKKALEDQVDQVKAKIEEARNLAASILALFKPELPESSTPSFSLSKTVNDLKKQLIQQIDNVNDQIQQAIENGKTAGLAALEAQKKALEDQVDQVKAKIDQLKSLTATVLALLNSSKPSLPPSPQAELSKIQNDLKKQLIQQIDNINNQIEQAIENGKTAGLAALEAQKKALEDQVDQVKAKIDQIKEVSNKINEARHLLG